MNNWTSNPCIIDTAENKDINLHVSEMEWWPGAPNDDLSVKDSYGSELWKLRAAAGAPNGESEAIEHKSCNRHIKGINVETIDGGTLKIYWT